MSYQDHEFYYFNIVIAWVLGNKLMCTLHDNCTYNGDPGRDLSGFWLYELHDAL